MVSSYSANNNPGHEHSECLLKLPKVYASPVEKLEGGCGRIAAQCDFPVEFPLSELIPGKFQ